MNVLILGANGQVGYELSQLFPRSVALTRSEVDYTVPGQISAAIEQHQPDVVINAVAYTAVDKAQTEPSLAMLVNAVAVQEMARACQKNNIWCIHYSTDYVFNGQGDRAYQETDPVSPLGIYGETKLAGEEFLRQECSKHIILRTSWVYSWRGANFVKTMLRLADQRDEISVVDDQVGNPTYAVDIAAVTKQVVEQLADDPSLAGVYHLSGAQTASWYQFACEIFRQAGKSIQTKPIATHEYPTPAQRPQYSVLDNSKLQQTFSIQVPGYDHSLGRCLELISLA